MPRRKKKDPNRTKWDDAVSPLQRARHDHQIQQDVACLWIRDACPGHSGDSCKLDPSKLSEYENGRRPPSLIHVQAICEAYQRGPEDLGLITWRKKKDRAATADAAAGTQNFPEGDKDPNVQFRTYGRYPDSGLESLVLTLRGDDLTQFASLAGETEGSTAVDRNKFLKGMGAAAGAAVTDPFLSLARLDRAALNATMVSTTALEQLEQAAYLHGRSYYEMHLPGHAELLVTDWANAGRLLHETQTPSGRIRLSDSYARLSGVLGLYYYDNGNNTRAVGLYENAEDAAREAGNSDLLAWLFERHAEVYNYGDGYGGNPRAFIALAERGLEAAGHTETLTVARLHGAAASAYASVGDSRFSAAHRGESARILEKGTTGCWPSDQSMPRGFSFTTDALLSCSARSHLRLGEYAKSASIYKEALSQKEKLGLSASTVPAVPLNRIQHAQALVHTGELEEATHRATAAVQEYHGVSKPLILGQARTFVAELTEADSSGTYARGFSEFLREQVGALGN